MKDAVDCSICDETLGNDRVFEHNHVTGKLRGIAHSKCNISCRTPKFIPVIFHNGSKYNFKQLLRCYWSGDDNEKQECIANNSEEFISFSICVPTGSFQNDQNQQVNTFEKLQFIDSFQFQAKSLSSLIETMNTDNVPIATFKEGFSHFSQYQQNLILQKGVYPYSCIDSIDKFQETELSPIWIDTLSSEPISDQDYQHA